MLTPIVKWAQNGPVIDLTVVLTDVSNPEVRITQTAVSFTGTGVGAQGENMYHVDIDLFNDIVVEESSHHVLQRHVGFKLTKKDPKEEWPRLLKLKSKPSWLKIDFDKWKFDDSDEEKKGTFADLAGGPYDKEFENRILEAKEDVIRRGKIGWLTAYALFEIICYFLILYKLFTSVTPTKFEDEEDIWFPYGVIYDTLYAAQVFSLCEIIHPLVGVTEWRTFKGAATRVGLSNFIVFAVFAPSTDVQGSQFVVWLTFLWSAHEIIRHTHDCFTHHKLPDKIIKWVSDNNWLVFYPQLVFVSGKAWIQAITSAEDHGRMLLGVVPNIFGMVSSYAWFLKICFLLYVPLCIAVFRHMWADLTKSYSKKKRTKKD